MFAADLFTPTKWDSAADKAKFANKFVSFVQGGFKREDFAKWFYQRLSNCFFHIAHHDVHGFYETWFDTPSCQVRFIENALDFPCYGQPEFNYCDVEKALQDWINTNGTLKDVQQIAQLDERERELVDMHRLQKKYHNVEEA